MWDPISEVGMASALTGHISDSAKEEEESTTRRQQSILHFTEW